MNEQLSSSISELHSSLPSFTIACLSWSGGRWDIPDIGTGTQLFLKLVIPARPKLLRPLGTPARTNWDHERQAPATDREIGSRVAMATKPEELEAEAPIVCVIIIHAVGVSVFGYGVVIVRQERCRPRPRSRCQLCLCSCCGILRLDLSWGTWSQFTDEGAGSS